MTTVFLYAVLGLGAGSAYALIAQGLILVHRASGVVNFAQGALAMFTAYFYTWLTGHGFSNVSAALVAIAGAGVLGAVVQQFVMRPLGRAPLLAKLVATLGVVLVLEALAGIVFGYDLQTAPPLLPTSTVHVFGTDVGLNRIILFVIAIALAAALSVFSRRTTIGSLFRAASDSEQGLAILGYSQNAVSTSAWVAGSMLGRLRWHRDRADHLAERHHDHPADHSGPLGHPAGGIHLVLVRHHRRPGARDPAIGDRGLLDDLVAHDRGHAGRGAVPAHHHRHGPSRPGHPRPRHDHPRQAAARAPGQGQPGGAGRCRRARGSADLRGEQQLPDRDLGRPDLGHRGAVTGRADRVRRPDLARADDVRRARGLLLLPVRR